MQTYWDTQSTWTPLSETKCTEPYYTRIVLPIEECRDTLSRQTPSPANQAKVYRALLHEDSITNRWMQMYWDTQNRQTPPTNQLHAYKALLHQDSIITYRRMQVYWDTHSRKTAPQWSQSVQSATTPAQYYW